MKTKAAKLVISQKLWKKLISELNKRGKGLRESGAFLLAKSSSLVVTGIAYYDDLDPNALNLWYIRLSPNGFVRLWQKCAKLKMHVVADVHTHPTMNVQQSHSDRTQPMISQKGHIAIIIPCLAQIKTEIKDIGLYELLSKKWHKWVNPADKLEIKPYGIN